jgi:hypothetical protein
MSVHSHHHDCFALTVIQCRVTPLTRTAILHPLCALGIIPERSPPVIELFVDPSERDAKAAYAETLPKLEISELSKQWLQVRVCARARACVCVCVRACVRECVRVCVCVCVCWGKGEALPLMLTLSCAHTYPRVPTSTHRHTRPWLLHRCSPRGGRHLSGDS